MRLLRSILAGIFFLSFGLGSLLIGCILFPLILLFGPNRCARRCMRALVRASYRLFVGAARVTGLFRVALSPDDRARLASTRGHVIVANHLTLIDVVIFVAVLPDATAIAKAAAGRNFFYSRIVNSVFLVNDDPARVLDEAGELLAQGVNLIVFPEGTRTPLHASRRKLRRGAAQIALHAHAPILCVRLDCDPPVLAKGQSWHDVADRTIVWTLRVKGEIPARAVPPDGTPHAAAVALTDEIYGRIWT